MNDEKIIINTDGGPVFNGCTLNGIQFVAKQYIQNNNNQAPVNMDAEAVNEDLQPTADTACPKPRSKRRLLFNSEEEQKRWADIFVQFLKRHKSYSESLTTSPDNIINRALACFHEEWNKKGVLNANAHKKAPTLFLIEDCGIKGIEERTHSNRIQEILNRALEYENNSTKSNLKTEIEELVKEHFK